MKIGALERVDEIFRVGQKGLEFVHDHKPPPVLPNAAGSGTNLTYFRVNQNASKDEWTAVAQTYNLAIRLNQTLLVGSMDGRSDVTIQAGGKTANMRFTLYVVLPAAQAAEGIHHRGQATPKPKGRPVSGLGVSEVSSSLVVDRRS